MHYLKLIKLNTSCIRPFHHKSKIYCLLFNLGVPFTFDILFISNWFWTKMSLWVIYFYKLKMSPHKYKNRFKINLKLILRCKIRRVYSGFGGSRVQRGWGLGLNTLHPYPYLYLPFFTQNRIQIRLVSKKIRLLY